MISQTQKFLQFAISTDGVVDPCQHPCLQVLPTIFLKAIKGIAGQVDAFLGSLCVILPDYCMLSHNCFLKSINNNY